MSDWEEIILVSALYLILACLAMLLASLLFALGA